MGGDGGQRGAERVFERVDAGVVAIAPGEDGCPAGHRDGVGAITVVEYHSLGGKPADMTVLGVRGEVPAVDAPRLRGVVVAQDKQDIGACCLCRSVLGRQTVRWQYGNTAQGKKGSCKVHGATCVMID